MSNGTSTPTHLARGLLAGALTNEAVLIGLANLEKNLSRKQQLLAHLLYHYIADEDLRLDNAEYAQQQLDQLLQLVKETDLPSTPSESDHE